MTSKDVHIPAEPWDIVRRVADYARAQKPPYMISAEQFGRAVATLLMKFPESNAFGDFLRGFDFVRNSDR